MGKDRLEILSELIQVIGVITDGTKYYGHTTLSELSETETTPTEDVETTVDNSSLWQEVTDIKEGMGKVYATLTNLLKSIHEIEDGLIDHKSKIEALNDVYNKSFDKPKAKKGQDQVSKKRGPYKKKRKKSVSKVKPIEPTTPSLGIRTISKFSKKIEYSLNNSKHFSRKELLAGIKEKHPDLTTLSGRDMIYEIRKARWRLDGRRRRDADKKK